MSNWLLTGQGRVLISVPPHLWKHKLKKGRADIIESHQWITPDHRRVHHFVVRELPRLARPMEPDFIAQGLDLELEKVLAILADLEKNMVFLTRNFEGNIHWSYPVTVDQTPHKLTFSTGEQLNAA